MDGLLRPVTVAFLRPLEGWFFVSCLKLYETGVNFPRLPWLPQGVAPAATSRVCSFQRRIALHSLARSVDTGTRKNVEFFVATPGWANYDWARSRYRRQDLGPSFRIVELFSVLGVIQSNINTLTSSSATRPPPLNVSPLQEEEVERAKHTQKPFCYNVPVGRRSFFG